ncbi:MAG: hypothetical protein LIP12_18535 [Clostridiales bacterium]|nr:hypothetical protein [Clostridiales bacterium]
MNNKHILHITAVTEVGPDAQKCTRAVLEYDRPVALDTAAEAFRVEKRTITDISVSGNLVTLELSAADEAAALYHPGNPWQHTATTLETASVKVSQTCPICAADGTILVAMDAADEMTPSATGAADREKEGKNIPMRASDGAESTTPKTTESDIIKITDQNDRVQNLIVDDFIQGEFEGLKYNLFIPKDLAPQERCPLVQFIHDAGPCGADPRLTLAQGMGAIVWAKPEEQAKRKCFVLAPQFDGPPIVDDDWNVDPRLETAKRLLDWVCEAYPVDTDRLYTTGQSMGCMSSIVLNVRYPELFAASYLVAGQWDDRQIGGLEKQNLWMLNSMGDAKAFPIMNQMACEMESKGALVARKVINADAPQEELSRIAKELVETGANVIYTPYKIESVANGWSSRGGEHHVSTWKTAYNIEAIRAWMFSKTKNS